MVKGIKRIISEIYDIKKKLDCMEQNQNDTIKKINAVALDLGFTLQKLGDFNKAQEDLFKSVSGIGEINDTLITVYGTLKDITDRLDWLPNQNIRRRLYEKSGMDTAEYVLEHMNCVRAFNRTIDILPYAINCVEIGGGGYT